MKKYLKRFIALCLCFATVAGYVPAIAPTTEADATLYASYTDVAKIYTTNGCYAMQGLDVDDTYIYCAKVNTNTHTAATIARVHKGTGSYTWMTNSATGTYTFTQLAHANDLAVCTVNGIKTMFVGTGGDGMGDYSLVRLAMDGTTMTEVGHYNMKHNGAECYMAGVKVVCVNDTEITLILKKGNYVYTAKIPVNKTSGDINMTYLGKLDFSAVNFNGTIKDMSEFVVQGFGYKDNKLFVPMSANYQDSTSHISTIVCFDIDGINGTFRNDPNMSVWIEDSTYTDLFEIESCAICPTDGRLYFATNRRLNSDDGSSDGVHVLNNFVYSPAMGDSTTPQNYRFETMDNKLVSVTDGGAVYNSALQHLGSVSGSTVIAGRFSLDKPILLKHNEPWILEWKASNWTKHSLFLSTYDKSGYEGNYYLYRRSGSGLVALGFQGDGQYHNYGLMLSDHGIKDTAEHVYRLENQINTDGTNMVYLWVDGTKLGALNNYYVGATSQNKTDNWVSGKDFSFSYVGTSQHLVSANLSYLQVWTRGNLNSTDEPNMFRWETTGNAMTPVAQFSYTANPVTVLSGSCSSGTYSDYHAELKQGIILLHDRPWVLEWKSDSWSGGSMLFSSGDTSMKYKAPYLYRSGSIVSIGYCDGTSYHNYGIRLADHGVDPAAGHTYRLTNKIAADGSNMVYLSVDGKELGAMNGYYLGSTAQGTTSNWISGRDFTFTNLGTYQHRVKQPVSYIQVWENGIPANDTPDKYRWECAGSSFSSITGDYTENTPYALNGSISGGVFSESCFRLEKSIVLRHSTPWSIKWESEGTWSGTTNGAFLFSASLNKNELNAPYLFRRKNSDLLAFGFRNDSNQHENYGIRLSDKGIDGTVSHVYELVNRINTDGSNMVYLLVDGVEIGAMNNQFFGTTNQGVTSNWISGKDFVFSYMGTPQFNISNVSMDYIEVDEGAVQTGTVVFKNWDGTVLSSKEYNIGDTVTPPANPTRPAEQGVVYTFAGWDQSVTTCQGDAVYTATYTSSAINYTVTFKDYDGTVISSATYNYGDTIAVPANPTRAADQVNIYTFAGWDQPVTTCQGAAVYTATYTTVPISYTVTFVDYDGTELSSGTYHYGDTVTVPADPIRSAYTFAGWSPAVTTCTGNQVYTATYTVKSIPTITPTRPSVSFKDEVQLNVYFICENLDGVALEDMGLLTWTNAQEDGTIETAATVTPGAIVNGSEYTAHTGGISAKNMGNTIYFKVYAKLADGTYVYSKMLSYSIKTYALQQISTSTNERVRALCVALLNYGAAAQTYFNYQPYALMNSSLTTEQQALVSGYDESMVAPIVTAAASKTVNFTKNGGLSTFYPSVSFEGAFGINCYAAPSATPSGNVTLYYWYQDAYESAATLTTGNASGSITMELADGKYVGKVAGIVARKLDSTVYISLVYTSGDTTYCSGVISYSVGRYLEQIAADSTNAAQPLGAAAAVYGYYAKEYFASLA